MVVSAMKAISLYKNKKYTIFTTRKHIITQSP